jgi:broad specificity polyphosphatase/5'/3'-nucleotidase SurE
MAIRKELPDGGITWTIDGEMSFAETAGSDFEAVYSGYVSVTPLHLDMTNHTDISRLHRALSDVEL